MANGTTLSTPVSTQTCKCYLLTLPNWRFTTDDARIKLKRLYPQL